MKVWTLDVLAGGRPGLLLFIPPFTAARKREPCPAQRAPRRLHRVQLAMLEKKS